MALSVLPGRGFSACLTCPVTATAATAKMAGQKGCQGGMAVGALGVATRPPPPSLPGLLLGPQLLPSPTPSLVLSLSSLCREAVRTLSPGLGAQPGVWLLQWPATAVPCIFSLLCDQAARTGD